jgi:cell division septal protein FtsQ
MQRKTRRRAYSHPTPRRQLRGPTGVRTTSSVRSQRSARPVRATAVANGSTVALPRSEVSAETWRAARPKVLALAIAVLLGSLVFAFFNFDFFYVFEPDVIGLENLSKEDVIQASGVTGYNVFFVDGTSVERALSKLPEIKSVHVVPGLPSQLSIQITEREPTVAWQRGTERFWVDTDGVVFRAHGDKPDLTTIRDLDQAPVKPGGQVTLKALDAYQALQIAMPEAPRQLDWSSARGLAFTDEHGWKIYLGDENGMTGKVVKFKALVQQLESQKAQVKFIDLGRGDPYYQ